MEAIWRHIVGYILGGKLAADSSAHSWLHFGRILTNVSRILRFLQFGLALGWCCLGAGPAECADRLSSSRIFQLAILRSAFIPQRSNTATPSRGRPYSNAPRIPPGLLGTHAFVIGLVGLVFVDGLWLVDIVE